MIRETKKMIWVFIIVALIVFIAAPGSQCSSIIMVLLVLALIFLIFREQRQPYPFPPPQYPMHPGYQVQPPPAQSGKVTLCSNCYAQLELDWVACPFCGQTVKTAEKTAEQKQDNAT